MKRQLSTLQPSPFPSSSPSSADFLQAQSQGLGRIALAQRITQWQKKRVLIVGDVGVDRYTVGKVVRISPEAPVPVLEVESETLKLGLAANVADNVQALGGQADLLGVMGCDRSAQDFKRLLRQAKIAPHGLVAIPGRRTALKDRIIGGYQQIVRVDYESVHGLAADQEQQVLEHLRTMMPVADGVIVEDYAKGLISQAVMKSLLSLAAGAKGGKRKCIVVDPNKHSPLEWYRGVSGLTPNTAEAESLSGLAIHDDSSLEKAGFKILQKSEAEWVMITRGKDGMAIFSQTNGKKVVRIPTFAKEVFDVSGAGDTVVAVVVLALIAGASLQEAAVLGNLAAGVEVGKRGTATVSRRELFAALQFFELQAGG